jgi:hypothetical protein
VEFDHSHAVSHQAADQLAAVFARHREIVIAKRLKTELDAVDERTIRRMRLCEGLARRLECCKP